MIAPTHEPPVPAFSSRNLPSGQSPVRKASIDWHVPASLMGLAPSISPCLSRASSVARRILPEKKLVFSVFLRSLPRFPMVQAPFQGGRRRSSCHRRVLLARRRRNRSPESFRKLKKSAAGNCSYRKSVPEFANTPPVLARPVKPLNNPCTRTGIPRTRKGFDD
jgi:hypothetical protein